MVAGHTNSLSISPEGGQLRRRARGGDYVACQRHHRQHAHSGRGASPQLWHIYLQPFERARGVRARARVTW